MDQEVLLIAARNGLARFCLSKIAARAGVSVSSVQAALGLKPQIRTTPELREKVLAAIGVAS